MSWKTPGDIEQWWKESYTGWLDRFSPFQLAVLKGHLPIVLYFLGKFPDLANKRYPDLANRSFYKRADTPLVIAIKATMCRRCVLNTYRRLREDQALEIIKALLEKGADPNLPPLLALEPHVSPMSITLFFVWRHVKFHSLELSTH